MKIRRLYPGSFGANCWLLCSRDGQAAVVDPSPDAGTVSDALREEGAKPSVILLTHGHFDHILSLDTLRDATGIPALIHRDDLGFPNDARKNAFEVFFHQRRVWRTPDGTFRDGRFLRELLKEKLPKYMIPKNIIFIDEMPMTVNGKLDRKKLEGMLA